MMERNFIFKFFNKNFNFFVHVSESFTNEKAEFQLRFSNLEVDF